MTVKISLVKSSIRVGEVNSLAQTILKESAFLAQETDSYLLFLFDELQALQQKLNVAILALRTKSKLHQKMLDMKSSFRTLYNLVQTYGRMKDFAQQAEVAAIDEVMSGYAHSISRSKNQFEVNSYVSSLLQDLSKLSAFETEGSTLLSNCLVDLKETQQAYLKEFSLYSNQRRIEEESGSASFFKDQILRLINDKLILHLNAMLQVSMTEYVDLAETIDLAINKRNIVLKARKTRRNQAETPTEVA